MWDFQLEFLTKAPSQEVLETTESSLAKRKRKDKFPLIVDLEYFYILGEVALYPSEFTEGIS